MRLRSLARARKPACPFSPNTTPGAYRRPFTYRKNIMPVITTNNLSPVTVRAIARDDHHARIDGAPAHEWLALFWAARISNSGAYGAIEETAECLRRLADALAVEDIGDAVDHVIDYRTLVGRPVNGPTLTKMMLEAMLDWSKWTGRADIDNIRAESWLRSLLA